MYKIFRHIFSGYFLERGKIIRKLKQPNRFIPTEIKYTLPKIVVYTVSTGGYDTIKDPVYIDKDFDYYVFTNVKLKSNSTWKQIEFEKELQELGEIEKSRIVKILPHRFFREYDISIYIDGNVIISKDIRPLIYTLIEKRKIMALHRHNARDCAYHEGRIIWAQGRAKLWDVVEQLCSYKKAGFPRHFGLFENNIIIRFHNDNLCIKVMETWWNEFVKYKTRRDQLSLTYSLWKNGLRSDDVLSLGNSSRNSPYFSVVNHSK